MPRKRKTEAELSVSVGIEQAPTSSVMKSKPARTRTVSPARRTNGKSAAGSTHSVQDADAVHGEITRLAYFYWEARGRAHGSPEDDWYRAEQELQARIASAS